MVGKTGFTNFVHWEMGEIQALNASSAQLTPVENAQLMRLGSDQRKREFKAIRVLKQGVFGADEIIYGMHGKPEIHQAGVTIGISHSSQWALFAHATVAFGCDIEEPHERINRVVDRFCRSEELELFDTEIGIIQLTQLWSCKEAIYKLVNEPGIHWKDQMRCTAISESKFMFTVETPVKHPMIHCETIQVNNVIISIATYA
jgi:phosphopantetheinyl transferase